MQTVAPGWALDVRRGPGWLFVKLQEPTDDEPQTSSLVDQVWSLLESHLVYRVVLELDGVRSLNRDLLAQLVRLCHRIHQHGGVLRVCGLSPANRKIMENSGVVGRLPLYQDVEEAVMGEGRKPR